MSTSRSRISSRHLLALCTFLVPLAVLAVVGRSELERQEDRLQVEMSRGARLFLQSAEQAFEKQFAQLRPLVDRSRKLVPELGTTRATLRLREQEDYAPLLDIVVIDKQAALVHPRPPATDLGLPLASKPRTRENAITRGLAAVDLLLAHGELPSARQLLVHLAELDERAGDISQYARIPMYFRLATVQRKLGEAEAARANFELVRDAVFTEGRTPRNWFAYFGTMAETALAEMGGPPERLDLLERIATQARYRGLADGLRTALVERLVHGFPADHPQRGTLTEMLVEEHQRAQTRAFAGDYEMMLDEQVRTQLVQIDRGTREPGDLEIVATLGDATTLLWFRAATAEEKQRFGEKAALVGLHIDLDLLMAPALEPYIATDGPFVLAVRDPKAPLVEPPETVPDDFTETGRDVHGMRLSAWPANADSLLVEADSQARNRMLLVLLLIGAAMVGAVWLWRSVTREAELARLKVDLVSRVSHELKTPLALIRMYGETLGLGRARDGDQARHFGNIIARESERLTTMIQRILDFSRQQSGSLDYAPKRVDLTELLCRVCDAYTPHLEARGAVLVDSVRGEAFVHCDETACESAIINLLENAAKYGIDDGEDQAIEMDLDVTETSAIVEVRDRGRGLPAKECKTVFEAFFRASNSGEVRGAGIGLNLVRHFARAHGGDVTASPRPGGGAVFRLTLPLAGTQTPPPESQSKSDDRTP